ncbi:unnamed protein product [Closterium sp. Naga37s-1]|nr:unnamed protein product [Closterium sp. Naga37s-1]
MVGRGGTFAHPLSPSPIPCHLCQPPCPLPSPVSFAHPLSPLPIPCLLCPSPVSFAHPQSPSPIPCHLCPPSVLCTSPVSFANPMSPSPIPCHLCPSPVLCTSLVSFAHPLSPLPTPCLLCPSPVSFAHPLSSLPTPSFAHPLSPLPIPCLLCQSPVSFAHPLSSLPTPLSFAHPLSPLHIACLLCPSPVSFAHPLSPLPIPCLLCPPPVSFAHPQSPSPIPSGVLEMWGYDPHPTHGVRPCSEASFLIIQASVSGRVHTPDEEDEVEHVTEMDEAPTSDTHDMAAGDEDAVAPESPHRRWEERGTKKRRREELEGVENDDLAMDDLVEEVTVGQRFSVHFHHVMVRNATLARLGLPMSAEDVAAELALAADHWAGLHAGCARGDVLPRCVKDNWGPESAVYEPDSETHKAVKEWLATHCSAEQMRPYVLGAGSWLNESFHSLICKYAPKRVRFLGSMEARIALAVLHWNNTVERVVKAYKTRLRKATRVRRGKKDRVLGPMDWTWVDDIMRDWTASRGRPEPAPPVVTPDSDAPESVPPRDTDYVFSTPPPATVLCPGRDQQHQLVVQEAPQDRVWPPPVPCTLSSHVYMDYDISTEHPPEHEKQRKKGKVAGRRETKERRNGQEWEVMHRSVGAGKGGEGLDLGPGKGEGDGGKEAEGSDRLKEDGRRFEFGRRDWIGMEGWGNIGRGGRGMRVKSGLRRTIGKNGLRLMDYGEDVNEEGADEEASEYGRDPSGLESSAVLSQGRSGGVAGSGGNGKWSYVGCKE